MKTMSAAAKYNWGLMSWMALYVALLFFSIWYIKTYAPTGPLLYLLAVSPALPIGGAIIVFMQYLDRVDEYVRKVMSQRFISSTGLVLFICTALGFIEENAGGPHLPMYMVYPMFWAMFGLMSCIFRQKL